MNDELQKTLRDLRKTLGDHSGEITQAMLDAVWLDAVSYTVFVGVVVSLYVCFLVLWGAFAVQEDRLDGPMVFCIGWATAILVVVLAFYFGTSSWMGLVNPKAALASEILP
jgi:hypothetical protein